MTDDEKVREIAKGIVTAHVVRHYRGKDRDPYPPSFFGDDLIEEVSEAMSSYATLIQSQEREKLEEAENRARGYQAIAGAVLSGTNEADEILAANPPKGFDWTDAWKAAFVINRERQDKIIASCVGPAREGATKLERERCAKICDDYWPWARQQLALDARQQRVETAEQLAAAIRSSSPTQES